jgi:dipeptidyl aminopeptidase/acylaminoacyl peptidase
MKRWLLRGLGLFAIAGISSALAGESGQKVIIPEPGRGPPQLISVEDMAALRRIDALSLSPDKQRFAVLIRQADAAANDYRRGWFVGSTRGGALTPIGDGGEAPLAVGSNNKYTGDTFAEPTVQWSRDGQWLAYALTQHGEAQLWRSKADGSVQEQLTHNAADVQDLAWSDDGKSIHFTVGTPRADINAQVDAMERNGYQYDTELFAYTDFMTVRPKLMRPDRVRTLWTVSLADREERLANDAERTAFERSRAQKTGGSPQRLPAAAGMALASAERSDGAQAWSSRQHEKSYLFQMHALLPGSSTPVQCPAAECVGFIDRVWWREDGAVIFLRREGTRGAWAGFYAWSPATGAVSLVLQLRDFITHCDLAAADRLICARQATDRPSHIAAIDFKSGAVQVVADVNPEFRNRRLGKIESFEWDTPKFAWNEPGGQLQGTYPARAYGYILYPPDFDPKRKYPVFISPYSITGFDNGSNQEYALHALAARGFVVLLTQFPQSGLDVGVRLGPDFMKLLYSAELDFPLLSMLSQSTLKALDTVAARGFIDVSRVGIGGLSNGAFVPLFMLQRHDRIAAIAVSSGGWDPMEYYQLAPAGRPASRPAWPPKPVGEEALKYWAQLDLAANVATIEAPLLMNASANEMYGAVRLLRHMEDAGKPYDAYVFPRENHVKWQPAHLLAIMRRNVDWFRFWLQSYEDPAAGKARQYSHWRKLREMQSTRLTVPPSAPAATK